MGTPFLGKDLKNIMGDDRRLSCLPYNQQSLLLRGIVILTGLQVCHGMPITIVGVQSCVLVLLVFK